MLDRNIRMILGEALIFFSFYVISASFIEPILGSLLIPSKIKQDNCLLIMLCRPFSGNFVILFFFLIKIFEIQEWYTPYFLPIIFSCSSFHKYINFSSLLQTKIFCHYTLL
ncbi:hypothetical protein H312_02752 [Anncaliia algerae PRA339]|uniref:Uncharacterized protein n=1 Tax=Anncaliia algerae PRA339 TaxID=1288291 RepID=A0A059EYL2_9MICR|nr:hypothetical protein H312_02752 [Anncaliia algerae PRA339]